MVIGIFGESCTGKSTLADRLRDKLNAQVFTGKDYLRLAKSETAASLAFKKMLTDAVTGDHLIYVISEKAHLAFLPNEAIRVLVTADLDTIKARFAQRLHGNLPAPVAAMLERNHGCFDQEPYHVCLHAEVTNLEEACGAIIAFIK